MSLMNSGMNEFFTRKIHHKMQNFSLFYILASRSNVHIFFMLHLQLNIQQKLFAFNLLHINIFENSGVC